jgi:hypothetical protein
MSRRSTADDKEEKKVTEQVDDDTDTLRTQSSDEDDVETPMSQTQEEILPITERISLWRIDLQNSSRSAMIERLNAIRANPSLSTEMYRFISPTKTSVNDEVLRLQISVSCGMGLPEVTLTDHQVQHIFEMLPDLPARGGLEDHALISPTNENWSKQTEQQSMLVLAACAEPKQRLEKWITKVRHPSLKPPLEPLNNLQQVELFRCLRRIQA